jgi:hypothetical protein
MLLPAPTSAAGPPPPKEAHVRVVDNSRVLHLLADRTGMPLSAGVTASGGGNDDGASVRIHADAGSLDGGRERRVRLDPEAAQVLAADEHVG